MSMHEKYAEERYGENGELTCFRLKETETFNFGYDVADEIARSSPQRRAMVWRGQTGEEVTYTFADVKRQSDRTANYLKSLGIRKGDTVLVALNRQDQFWIVAIALHKLGAILLPADVRMTRPDAEYRIKAARVKMAICAGQSAAADAVEEAGCPSLALKGIVNGARPGWHSFDEEVPKAGEVLARETTRLSEPMLLLFSSGTAGNPKMILHNHGYPLSYLPAAKHWQCVKPEGLHFSVSEAWWSKTFWGELYGQWLMEAGVLFYDFERFIPAEILSLIETYRITTLCCPPAVYGSLLGEDMEKYDLSSLAHATAAGEALSPAVFREWKRRTGLSLMEGFGQAETALLIGNLKGTVPKPGSIGKPAPCYAVDLIDEEGQSCPPGVAGEIALAADPKPLGLMDGYYGEEERTAKAFREGWYRTGDAAWRDEDGFFFYLGRNDDIIRSSGYRISPFEIESVLQEHPAVLECAVTGVPDESRGQLVKATVVLAEGYSPAEALKCELQEHVKSQTAPYKYPSVIEFVDALPRTMSGKIRRAVIRSKDLFPESAARQS